MYVSGIKLANGGNNVSSKNTKEKVSYSSGLYAATRGKDSVSFGTIDPVTWAAISGLKGIFGHLKIDSVLDKARGHFYSGNIKPGLEIAIAVNDKVGAKTLTYLVHDFDRFLGEAANYAGRLSDREYENRDIKQKFLESVFLRQIKAMPYEKVFNVDRIPAEAKELFMGLNNSTYGEFKKHLISKAVIDKKIILLNTDRLLDGVADNNFKKKISSIVEAQDKLLDNEFGSADFWRDSQPRM